MTRLNRAVLIATPFLVGVAVAVPEVFGGAPDSKSVNARAQGGGWHVQARSAAHRRKGLKFAYVRGRATIQPGAFLDGPLTCPRKYPHPISGFFDSSSEKLVLTRSRPEPSDATPKRIRKWAIGTTNFDTVPADVIVGIVCIK
jgi:hypothetical protein